MNLMDRMIDIERAEIGYKEFDENWTKYGEWYAENIAHNQSFATAPWCAMFQTWSAAQAGLPDTCWPYESPYGSEVNYMAGWFEERGFRTGADDMPEPGDVIFYSWTGNENDLDHVGLCWMVRGTTADDAIMYVIEGNYDNQVKVRCIDYRNNHVCKTFRLPAKDIEYFPDLSFMLSRGSAGEAVEILQAGLISRGYSLPGGVDGYFGSYTEEALIQYQRDVEIIADGKAGTETFSTLLRGF